MKKISCDKCKRQQREKEQFVDVKVGPYNEYDLCPTCASLLVAFIEKRDIVEEAHKEVSKANAKWEATWTQGKDLTEEDQKQYAYPTLPSLFETRKHQAAVKKMCETAERIKKAQEGYKQEEMGE